MKNYISARSPSSLEIGEQPDKLRINKAVTENIAMNLKNFILLYHLLCSMLYVIFPTNLQNKQGG